MTDLVYIPLVTWACAMCECTGQVEKQDREYLTRDRAIAEHKAASPLCAEVFGSGRLILVESEE
jgi:hypothetical protein